jgi:hypothetical protein
MINNDHIFSYSAVENKAQIPNHLKQVIGDETVDIIPWEISYLFFNKLNYHPRPVIQSYSAYDDYLDKLNYRKYMSSHAPEFIFFKIESIDFRHDLYDETKTKMALLLNYEVIDRTWNYLLLRKLKKPLQKKIVKTTTAECHIGDYIPIDVSREMQYAEIAIEYSWLGKLARILFQPPTLKATIQLEDGTSKTGRAVKTIVNGGIFINKFVSRTVRSADAFITHNGTNNMNVVGITFHTPHSWGFNHTFEIKKEYVNIENYTKNQPDTLQMNPPVAQIILPAATNNIAMSVDIYDNFQESIEMSGWAYIEGFNAENATIYTVLKGRDTSMVFPTQTVIREDMTQFTKTNLDSSGYRALIYKNRLPKDNYQIGLLITRGQQKALEYIGQTLKLRGFDQVVKDMHPPEVTDNLKFSIDELLDNEDAIKIKGWSHISGQGSEDSRIFIVLQSAAKEYVFSTSSELRPDVSAASAPLNLDESGFSTDISKKELSAGTYKIGILIIKSRNQKAFQFTKKEIKVNP